MKNLKAQYTDTMITVSLVNGLTLTGEKGECDDGETLLIHTKDMDAKLWEIPYQHIIAWAIVFKE